MTGITASYAGRCTTAAAGATPVGPAATGAGAPHTVGDMPVDPRRNRTGPGPRLALGVAFAAVVTAITGCVDGAPGATATTATTGGTPGTGVTGSPATPATNPTTADSRTAVVDLAFDGTGLDPARASSRLSQIVTKATYQTLTTFENGDLTKPVPLLADTVLSTDQRVLTMKIKSNAVFADGTPVTADDVVFSLERAKRIGTPAARRLDELFVNRIDEHTVTLVGYQARPQLPAELALPELSILEATAVRANGGTGTTTDTAATYLAGHSAGSGAYRLESASPAEIVLAANPNFTGEHPAYDRVVLRNTPAAAQGQRLAAGSAQLALDVPAPEAARLAGAGTAKVSELPAPSLLVLFVNARAGTVPWTRAGSVATALRDGLDRNLLARAAGPNALPAIGLVPRGIAGALETVPATASTDASTATTGPTGPSAPSAPAPAPTSTTRGTSSPGVLSARAALLLSGYAGAPVTLTYASDTRMSGVSTPAVVGQLRDQLVKLGLQVRLRPLPPAQASRAFETQGTQLGLFVHVPAYPDPAESLNFTPGAPIASWADWQTATDPALDALVRACTNTSLVDRPAAYQAWQSAQAASGPFVPLVQAQVSVLAAPGIENPGLTPWWTLDLDRLR